MEAFGLVEWSRACTGTNERYRVFSVRLAIKHPSGSRSMSLALLHRIPMKTLTPLLAALSLCVACQSTHSELHNTARPIGVLEAANDHVADIKITNQKIQGEGSGGSFLRLFKTGDKKYAEYMAYSGTFQSLASIVGDGRLGEIKRAAVRAACKEAGCDVIAYPVFEWDEEDFLIMNNYKVTVRGYAGYINDIRNVPRNIVPGTIYLGPPDGNFVPEGNRFRVNGASELNLYIGESSGGSGSLLGGDASGSSSAGTDLFGWQG